MSYVEEDIKDLENKVNSLEKVVSILCKRLIKEPLDHTEECFEYRKRFGQWECICGAREINEILNWY